MNQNRINLRQSDVCPDGRLVFSTDNLPAISGARDFGEELGRRVGANCVIVRQAGLDVSFQFAAQVKGSVEKFIEGAETVIRSMLATEEAKI